MKLEPIDYCGCPPSLQPTMSSEQSEQPCIQELAVLEKVLPKKPFLLKAALFQHTNRRWVVRVNMGNDFDQPELLEGVLTQALTNSGHNASTPKRFCQPIADLSPVGLADLDANEAASADEALVGAANRKVYRTT